VLLGVGLGLGVLGLTLGEARLGLGGLTALGGLVPLAVSVVVGGPVAAALAGAVAIGGSAVALGATAAVVVTARHVVPGLVLGAALARGWHLAASLVAVSGASAVALAGLLLAYAPGTPVGFLGQQVDAHVRDVERLATRLPLGGDPEWVAESARLVAEAMRVAGPAVILVGLLAVSLANYLGARLCLRGRGFRAFAQEAVPDHLVWAVIAGGVMVASQHEVAARVGLNLLLVLASLYAIQGLAVLRHLFQRARVPRPLQGVGFGLFVVQPLLLIGAAGLGLTDLWVDFRKIRRAPTPA
jgi:hypothetical protein